MITETVTTIPYGEFEELVKKVYGVTDYSFVAIQEGSNDSTYRFYPEGKEPLDEYDTQVIDNLKVGVIKPYINHVIFQDLVNRDILPPGVYLVEVFW